MSLLTREWKEFKALWEIWKKRNTQEQRSKKLFIECFISFFLVNHLDILLAEIINGQMRQNKRSLDSELERKEVSFIYRASSLIKTLGESAKDVLYTPASLNTDEKAKELYIRSHGMYDAGKVIL